MSKKHYSKEFIAQILELYDAGKTIQKLSSEFGVSLTSINRLIDNIRLSLKLMKGSKFQQIITYVYTKMVIF